MCYKSNGIVGHNHQRVKVDHFVDVVFTDFSKAFDRVNHNLLIAKLGAYGFDKNTLGWIQDFLVNREQRVVLGTECSSWTKVTSGVPQGSVLGPLLFLMYINDLPECLSCPSRIYADDSKLFGLYKKGETCKDFLQLNIDELVDWSSKWQIDLNFKKCSVMHLGSKNPEFEYTMITENNERIELK